jgi:hypothetical protein
MTTVFLSGSRRLASINQSVGERLDNMVANGLHIIVGDAIGADKAMQGYLASAGYEGVTVFCAGPDCRNNVGEWPTENVKVPSGLSGREFYEQKDKEMAKRADFGLVLWDGKSTGSATNVVELLKVDKKVVVYLSPTKTFHTLSNIDDFLEFLKDCNPQIVSTVSGKNRLKKLLSEFESERQAALAFL